MNRCIAFVLFFAACAPDENLSFKVRASVGQLHVTHAPAGAEVSVYDKNNQRVTSGFADALGSLMFRRLPPGQYTVKSGAETSLPRMVMTIESSKKPQSFYSDQRIKPGINYLVTRDGTTLSSYVTLPGPVDKGPYPTVVLYSGYSPSKPGEKLGDYEFLCGDLPALCDAPDDPSALLAALFGFATVSVNMRGTGCSGGAYDFFETMQLLDGYDIIETVAAQPWVMHHQVGMVGLSYPGISQLFVGAIKPPGLAAITPLSVIGNAATTLKPGGILNDGFALSWVTGVLDKAKPYGQGWEQARVDAGDKVCAENQLLHGQYIDNVEQARTLEFYDPVEHDAFNPTRFVDNIEVPVFLAGAFQDEQTGPFFSTLLDRFTRAAALRMTIYNGVHPDGFAPQVLAEWLAFLEIFVARRVPVENELVISLSPVLFDRFFGTGLRLPKTRWSRFASLAEAKAAWMAEPPLRVIFESGGVLDQLGAPLGTFERNFARFPPAETRARRWFFRSDGTLADTAPTETSAASRFVLDPEAGQRGILAPGGHIWDPLPAYDWHPLAPGKAVAFVSAPVQSDLVMVGSGSVDLWIKSSAIDADLEVNLSEVRPDGKEMYVQSGWLRASFRALGGESNELWPSPTYERKDWAPLVVGEWAQARVAIPGFAHVFRAGSRVRVSVDTPGDSRADWRFALKPLGEVTVTIGHEAAHASSVALPVAEGVTAPTPLPPCPSLRGQPCRDFMSYVNSPAP
jgi:predicted acyl esterase